MKSIEKLCNVYDVLSVYKIESEITSKKGKSCVFEVFKMIENLLVWMFETIEFFEMIRRALSLLSVCKTVHYHLTNHPFPDTCNSRELLRYVRHSCITANQYDSLFVSARSHNGEYASISRCLSHRTTALIVSNSRDANYAVRDRLCLRKVIIVSFVFTTGSVSGGKPPFRPPQHNFGGIHVPLFSFIYRWYMTQYVMIQRCNFRDNSPLCFYETSQME